MSDFWQGKHVAITGPSGFLGKPLCLALEQQGALIYYISHSSIDLRYEMPSFGGPVDVLFHLAADVGGIADNIKRPAAIFYNNVMINTRVIDACVRQKVGKVIALGSSCAYPKDAELPFVESDYLKGEPEPTNAPYAYSKRLLLTHLQSCHTQYGLNFTYLILANLYGEGCETDPEKAHVIGALVRKFYEAKRDNLTEVKLWGTGTAIRDFLHVNEAVDALMYMTESQWATNKVVNIGSGEGQPISSIANTIASASGYSGNILWDRSKPDGQAQRVLSTYEASLLGWRSELYLSEQLFFLSGWYATSQKELSPA